MAETILSTLNDLVDAEEAGRLLRVTPHTLTTWRCKGKGPKFVKYGRRIMYRRADLEAFAVSRVVDPADKRGAA